MPQRLHNKKTPLTGRRKCGTLYMSAAECRWPTIALPEMTGFYDHGGPRRHPRRTIALPEMTGFYDTSFVEMSHPMTIALPEMTGFYDLLFLL